MAKTREKELVVSNDRPWSVRYYLSSPIQVDHLVDAELLLVTFSTGIQDAISYPDFHCFASNQTGNSVDLAIGLAGLAGELFELQNVALSLGMFIAGSAMTGQIANAVGPRRRLWLVTSHLLQTALVCAAAALQYVHGTKISGGTAMAAISLLAFSSGAQVASMRPIRRPEITTAMATAAWVDLVIDPKVFALHNASRDRRVLFLVALVAGSFAGAYMHVGIGSPSALMVSAAGKLLVAVGLLVNRSEKQSAGPEPSRA